MSWEIGIDIYTLLYINRVSWWISGVGREIRWNLEGTRRGLTGRGGSIPRVESTSEELEAGDSRQNGTCCESEWTSPGTNPLRVGRVILLRQIP